jgi:hypothetical protein
MFQRNKVRAVVFLLSTMYSAAEWATIAADFSI